MVAIERRSLRVTAGLASAGGLLLAVALSAPAWGASPGPAGGSSAAPASDLCWDEALGRGQEPCPLAAGEYLATRLVPQLTFELGDGWLDYRYYSDGFALFHPADTAADLSLMVGPQTGEADASAAGLATYLASHPSVEQTGETTDVTVGGLPAQRLDLAVRADAPGLLVLAQDTYSLVTGDTVSAWIVDHPVAPIVLVLEVYAPEGAEAAAPEDVAAYRAEAEAVVASIAFPTGGDGGAGGPSAAPGSPAPSAAP